LSCWKVGSIMCSLEWQTFQVNLTRMHLARESSCLSHGLNPASCAHYVLTLCLPNTWLLMHARADVQRAAWIDFLHHFHDVGDAGLIADNRTPCPSLPRLSISVLFPFSQLSHSVRLMRMAIPAGATCQQQQTTMCNQHCYRFPLCRRRLVQLKAVAMETYCHQCRRFPWEAEMAATRFQQALKRMSRQHKHLVWPNLPSGRRNLAMPLGGLFDQDKACAEEAR
jgi:hypothetical protein